MTKKRSDHKKLALKALRSAAKHISKMNSDYGFNEVDSRIQRLIEQIANRYDFGGSAYPLISMAQRIEDLGEESAPSYPS